MANFGKWAWTRQAKEEENADFLSIGEILWPPPESLSQTPSLSSLYVLYFDNVFYCFQMIP